MQFLSKDKVAVFLKTVQRHAPEYYDFCLLLFRTGLRLGEALGLAWDCVDFNAKQIVVRRSFSHNYWDTPKSHKIRHVDMSDGLHKALWQRYQKRNENLKCNNGELIYLVFPKKNGEPLNPDKFRHNVFKPMLKKAGLPKMRIHDCRHTYASLLLQAMSKNNLGIQQLRQQLTCMGTAKPVQTEV